MGYNSQARMLRELHISNLAVIEDVTITFDDGLNCFTGQTGAGKSLILGAFELLLGLRSGNVADMIRGDADEARVSGVFELLTDWVAAELSQVIDQRIVVGDQLLVTRKLFASGRSSMTINGQPATAPMTRAVGELLVDVHGQHDHQYLLKPSNQLLILDGFAKSLELREQFAEAHGELRELRERQRELNTSRKLRQQQLELYEFQANEIDDADLAAGEYDALRDEHTRLSNVADLQQKAGAAHAALYEGDGAVVDRLQAIAHTLIDLADVDDQIKEIAEAVRTSTLSLQDASFDLGRYLDRLELDPQRLAEIEDRLNTLNRLIAKYGSSQPGVEAVESVLLYRDQIEGELQRLRSEDADLHDFDRRIAALQVELESVGKRLSQSRRDAAAKLTPLVEAELQQLGMADARLEVQFDTAESADKAGPSGLDSIEMLVRTNPGQPARPLRKIASGGELSRIMLALKSILAHTDRISVLVFDEIDANIGGRMGTVIGRKLRRLAAAGDGAPGHQILVITHLPQIAAFADRHLRISKAVEGRGKSKQTRTTVTLLEGKARVEELAEMMAGQDITPTTRKQARELLAGASDA